jgi:hypothetical protein
MHITRTAHADVPAHRAWSRGPVLLMSVILVLVAVTATSAKTWAQSPTYNKLMKDLKPGGSYRSSLGQVIEGLGTGSCAYSQSSIEHATVNSVNSYHDTVTEISPQAHCVSNGISSYESIIHGIESYVESNSLDPGRYWGGFMLDEEPGFNFSASQLETLNSYVESLMRGTSGISWYFEENQPNGWSVSTYNQILEASWPAPQVYSYSMRDAVNSECSTYSNCMNDVTVDSQLAYPWDNADWVTGQVHGSPWLSVYWGSSNYFANIWYPV